MASSLSSILGGSGVRKTRKARKSYDKSIKRRRARERKVVLPRLTKRINTLEARRARLSRPTTKVSAFGPDLEIRRQQRLAETERKLARTRAEHARIFNEIRTRRGRRAEPVTALEVGEALATSVPPLRGGSLLVKGGIAAARKLGGEAAVEAAPKVAARTSRGLSGVARAERRAAQRAAGKKVKPVQRGTRGQRRPFSARRRMQKQARRKRGVGEYRTRTRVPRSGPEARARLQRQYRKRKPEVLTKEGRQVKARRYATTVGHVGAVDPLAAGVAAAGLGTTAAAFVDRPGKTLETTARAIPGIATSAAAIPVDIGAAIVKGDPQPVEDLINQQTDYWKLVGGVISGKGADVTDPRTGETVHRSAEQIVQEDVGLIPALSGTITAAGLARRGRAPSVTKTEQKAAKLTEKLEHPKHAVRVKAQRQLEELQPGLRERHAERVREAKRKAATGERIESQFSREFIKSEGGEGLLRQLDRLGQQRLNDKVTVADTLQFLGREGLYGLNRREFLSELAQRREGMVDPNRKIRKTEVATRDVMDALENNPDVAADPAVVKFFEDYGAMQAGRSVERHTERTGVPQTIPDPDDVRAKEFHTARALGVMLPEETQAVRARIKQLRQQRPDLPVQEGHRRVLAQLDRRRAAGKPAISNRMMKMGQQEVKRPFKLAARMDRNAAQMEARGAIGEAAQVRAEAEALRKRAVEAKRAIDSEFATKVKAAREERGISEPIYFREADVTNKGSLNVMGDYPGSQVPKKEQRRMGELAKQGRIDESGAILLESAYRGRVAIEMRKHVRDFLDERILEIEGKTIRTGKDWRNIANDLPRGAALLPVQEFNRVLNRGAWDEAAGLVDDALTGAVREAKLQDGKKYVAVPKAALVEFRAQMQPYGKLKYLRASARLQSAMLIGASPAWFGYQLLASPLAAMVSHPNPARWAKASRKYLGEWRELPDQMKNNIRAHYGSTSADAIALARAEFGLRPDTVATMAPAAGVMMRSPVGRLMQSITDNLRGGGPLIAANRRYEGEIRDLVALIEMDKQLRPDHILRLADSIGQAHKIVAEDLANLHKKPLKEQLEFYDRNPEFRNRLVDAIDDAVGNWNALTHNERLAAATTVFYPFMRFSLRWLFVSMPKNRPVTTGVLMNLAQANAEELEQLLGGAPSFFPEWGNIVTHISEDKPVAIDLGRIAPGSNAIVEAFGQSGLNLQSVTRPLQPSFGVILSALAGQDPLSGRESEMSKLEIIARGLVALPTPTRPLAQKVGPDPSIYSELFRKISGREKNLAYYALPQVMSDLNREAEAVKASELLDKAFGDNDPDARVELEQMLRKYGLEPPENLSSLGSSSSESSSTPSEPTFPWNSPSSSSSGSGSYPWSD